jgi:hypothetical protein
MSQFTDIQQLVRDLTLDHFPHPAFAIKQKEESEIDGDVHLYCDDSQIAVLVADPDNPFPSFPVADPSELTPFLPSGYSIVEFTDYPRLFELLRKIRIDWKKDFYVDQWPTVVGEEPSTILLDAAFEEVTTEDYFVQLREYYFSNARYERFFRNYMSYYTRRYYTMDEAGQIGLEEAVNALSANLVYHAALWIAFYVMEDRRVYELSAEQFQGGVDGYDFLSGGASSVFGAQKISGMRTSMSIGSVFQLEDDPNAYMANYFKKPGGPVAQVGADNILGDDTSFWYRLQGTIRKRFEDIYRDYALRSNEVIEGVLDLAPLRDFNYFAYFDTYPFTLSPYMRGIFGGGRGSNDSSAMYNANGLV